MRKGIGKLTVVDTTVVVYNREVSQPTTLKLYTQMNVENKVRLFLVVYYTEPLNTDSRNVPGWILSQRCSMT